MTKSRLLIVLSCMVLVAFFGSSLVSGQKQIVIRAGTTDPIDNHCAQMMIRFKELVEKRSAGSIKVEVYPALQLGPTPAQVEAVRLGNQQIFVCTPAWLTSFVPQIGVLSFPYLFDSTEAATALLSGPLGAELEGYANKAGFTVLGYAEAGFRWITNNKKPITGPQDFKGMKIRLQSDPVQIETLKVLGANPTPMDRSEVFSALQQGVIDAQDDFVTGVYTHKMYEIQKYLSDVGMFYDMFGVWGNKRFFDGLSAEHKVIVEQSMKEAIEFQKGLVAEQNRTFLPILKERMTVNRVSDEARAEIKRIVKVVPDRLVNTFGKDLIDKVRKLANYY